MMEQQVILVNERDEAVGTMEKLRVHQEGHLHRAFSVFIFDSKGRMLLQQRASEKYHGAHLWTNACCSHPLPGEPVEQAATRRLEEELGFTTPLQKIFEFTYHAAVENNLVEHEYDHVFAGEYEGAIEPDPAEVQSHRFLTVHQVREELAARPEQFTSWFRIAFPTIEQWWQKVYGGTLTGEKAGIE